MPDVTGLTGKLIIGGIVGIGALWIFYRQWSTGQAAIKKAADLEATNKAQTEVDLAQFEIEEAQRKEREHPSDDPTRWC